MRNVLCETCMQERGPSGTRQIFAGGFEPAEYERVLRGVAKAPQSSQRYIKVNDERRDLPVEFYNCDSCNAEIRAGDRCGTWTVWTDVTGPIGDWEQEYIEVVPA